MRSNLIILRLTLLFFNFFVVLFCSHLDVFLTYSVFSSQDILLLTCSLYVLLLWNTICYPVFVITVFLDFQLGELKQLLFSIKNLNYCRPRC